MQLSKDRGVNHTLLDAQVRVELCAKKYRAAHQTYLDAVTDGRKAKKPVVYEEPPQELTPRTGAQEGEEKSVTGSATGRTKNTSAKATSKKKTTNRKRVAARAAG